MPPEQRLERAQVPADVNAQRQEWAWRKGSGHREREIVGDEAGGKGLKSHGASQTIVKPLAFPVGGKGRFKQTSSLIYVCKGLSQLPHGEDYHIEGQVGATQLVQKKKKEGTVIDGWSEEAEEVARR